MSSIGKAAVEEERDNSIQQEERMPFIARSIVLFGFVIFACLFLLLALYLAKSAMGVNLISGFSVGIWQWFKESAMMK